MPGSRNRELDATSSPLYDFAKMWIANVWLCMGICTYALMYVMPVYVDVDVDVSVCKCVYMCV